ncbi:MAG: hypothetical protein QM586_18975 [Xenophilus sp.]
MSACTTSGFICHLHKVLCEIGGNRGGRDCVTAAAFPCIACMDRRAPAGYHSSSDATPDSAPALAERLPSACTALKHLQAIKYQLIIKVHTK